MFSLDCFVPVAYHNTVTILIITSRSFWFLPWYLLDIVDAVNPDNSIFHIYSNWYVKH